ncbi:MAG: uracil-xanthine permease, partial [Clostridia bacterium]|nr:uracil-xanthine permease [Clostridia bacterium]
NYNLVHILVGIIAFFITVYASTKGSKGMKLIPFVIGILGAYIVAVVLTLIGNWTNCDYIKVVNFAAFDGMKVFQVPNFTFVGMFKEGASKFSGFGDVLNIFMLFAPVAFVVLAEHIADHKNLGSIIDRDLITEPGLHRTLLGDGLGSMIGSFFGGCPNTTYGESVGCVAITGNASISTIAIAAVYCIILSFFGPFTAFVNSIPSCITGGVCIALYGFIAVSGLKMLQPVNLNDNRNLFVVAAILVTGIGGLTLNLGPITISSIATALILGIVVNVLFNKRTAEEKAE